VAGKTYCEYEWLISGGGREVTEQQLKQAADILNKKRLKSDNIALGSVIPLPDGKKGVIVKEVELCSFREKL